jgi:RNA polymerase sigma-70 factor (ECF subfamily)
MRVPGPENCTDERTDEGSVVAGFRDGDPAAVRAVYRRYSGPMLTVARSMLGSRELADEAVQQAFVQAWRAAASYDPNRPLSSWLYAITRRVCIDLYRREHRQAALTDSGEPPAAAAPDDTAGTAERSWEAWEVRRAVDALSPRDREIMRLAYFEGLSFPDVAERLDLAVGTVKSRSHRAYRRLADRLGHLRASSAAVPRSSCSGQPAASSSAATAFSGRPTTLLTLPSTARTNRAPEPCNA